MNPKNESKRKKTIRKQEITKVAAKIIERKGYDATTLEDIATALDVTPAAIYYYFKNKQDILENVAQMLAKPLVELIKIDKLDLSPKDKLRQIIRRLVEMNATEKERATIFFEESHALPKEARETFRQQQKELERIIKETLVEGQKQGYFAFSDVRMTCFTILAASNWVYRWYRPEGELTPSEVADKIIEIIENGYVNAKTESRDVIHSGDENVYPWEVEEVLLQHPAISNAVVIGVSDPYWTERIHAVVALNNGANLTDHELVNYCKTKLLSYKVPKSVNFVNTLDNSVPRETLRHEIRAKYWKRLKGKK